MLGVERARAASRGGGGTRIGAASGPGAPAPAVAAEHLARPAVELGVAVGEDALQAVRPRQVGDLAQQPCRLLAAAVEDERAQADRARCAAGRA
jgi:hypothetical protein